MRCWPIARSCGRRLKRALRISAQADRCLCRTIRPDGIGKRSAPRDLPDLSLRESATRPRPLADCARLAGDPIPDGKRIKKLQGFKENLYRLRGAVTNDRTHGNTNSVVCLWLMPFMSSCRTGMRRPGSLTIHEWDSLKSRSCPAFPDR